MNKKFLFKSVAIEDKLAIESIINKYDISPITDYAFVNMYGWRNSYNTQWAIINDCLVIKFSSSRREHPCFLYPIGPKDTEVKKTLIQDLYKYSLDENYPLVLMSVSNECRAELEQLFPGKFTFFSDRNYFDYIYPREQLISLTGKKLQSKRNHINKFLQLYPDYIYEEIHQSNIEECIALAREWSLLHPNSSIGELSMIKDIIYHMEELDLLGGVIRLANDEVVAFTLGSHINHNTFDVHIEKANINIPGIYPMIGRSFAQHIHPKYEFINREEDLGIEGLRKSKLSLSPIKLLEKETAILRSPI